jgi:hypothetical protein
MPFRWLLAELPDLRLTLTRLPIPAELFSEHP